MNKLKLDTAAPSSPRCCWVLGIVSCVGAIAGILASTVLHDKVNDALHQGIAQQFSIASPQAEGFAAWQSTDSPNGAASQTDFYVYHINNPNDIILHGARPNVTLVGPLSYMYHQNKLNVSYTADGRLAEFVTQQFYTALDDRTRELEKQIITSIDAPLLGLLATDGGVGLDFLYLMDILSGNATLFNYYREPIALFVNRSAYEIIWGWDDPLLEFLGPIVGSPTHYPGLQANDTSAEAALAAHSKSSMYSSDDSGVLTRYFAEWDGYPEILCCPYGVCGDTGTGTTQARPWATNNAETITGSFGDNFHSFVSQDETLYVSTHDFGMYRSWPMVSTETTTIKDITLYTFRWADGVLGNTSVDPDEAEAYWVTGPSGVLNQSTCNWHAPILLSRPNFYGASEYLWQAIDGMSPPTQEHDDLYLNVEPYTGATMDYSWKVLVTINITKTTVGSKKNPSLAWTFFAGVTPVIMPLASVDRHATMNDAQAAQFKSQVYLALNAMAVLLWGGTALAIVLSLSSAACFMFGYLRHRSLARYSEVATASYYSEFYRPLHNTDGMPLQDKQQADNVHSGWTQVQ